MKPPPLMAPYNRGEGSVMLRSFLGLRDGELCYLTGLDLRRNVTFDRGHAHEVVIDQLAVLAGIFRIASGSDMDAVDLTRSEKVVDRLYRQVEQAAGMFHGDKVLHFIHS